MSEIEFKAGPFDGRPMPGEDVVYLNVITDSNQLNRITGYVTPAVAKLVKAAPSLLALVERYARECPSCGGTGTKHVKLFNEGIETDGERDCEDCGDLRAALDKALR